MKNSETVNALIKTVQNFKPVETPVRITLGDHRLRYHSASGHQIDLELVGMFSVKPLLRYLYDLEPLPCEIVNVSAFIRISVARQKTRLSFVLRYEVKHQTGKGRYTIQQKEKSFQTDARREMIIRYSDRYIERLRDVNTEKTADQLIRWYNEWAYPLTLEALAESLPEEQKTEAAKILKAYFAA